jgi:prepilin-type N-terminal cleavage/methylation domain-containing protein
MRKHVDKQRGDTLIEVLIAVAVLSLATVMTMTVVNNSHREVIGEINRETVRSEVNSQSELIQYFYDSASRLSASAGTTWKDGEEPYEVKVWEAIKTRAIDGPSASSSDKSKQADTCGNGQKAFYLARGIPKNGATERILVDYPDNDSSHASTDQFLSDDSDPKAEYYILTTHGSESLRGSSRWSAKPGNGIWINAIHNYTTEDGKQVANDVNDYYDFYIKACWLSANSSEDQFSVLTRINNSSVVISRVGGGGA